MKNHRSPNLLCNRKRFFLLCLCLLYSVVGVVAEETMIVNLLRGEPVVETTLYDDLAQADIVYVGETHRLERHHAWQRKILEALVARAEVAVLGIEQMEQQYQETLDLFNRGKIGFDELALKTDWGNRWRGYEAYRGLLELAQKHGVRVVALNAPAEVIRKIGRQGLDRLSEEERAVLPEEINLQDEIYRRHLYAILQVHMAFDETMLAQVFAAQVARDETMAENLVRAMTDKPTAKAMVVCGSGHVAFGLGIPDRIDARLPDNKKRIVLLSNSGELVLTPEEIAQSREIEISQEHLQEIDRSRADYLLVK